MDCMVQPRLVSIVANGVMADFAFFVPSVNDENKESGRFLHRGRPLANIYVNNQKVLLRTHWTCRRYFCARVCIYIGSFIYGLHNELIRRTVYLI